MVTRIRIVMLAALVSSSALSCTRRPSSRAGELIVIVVVDQLRFDYLDRFQALWKDGVERLTTEGAVFDHAYFPYLSTVTCAGHATIATGTFPSTHGIVLNEWWQRAAGRRVPCTEDASVTSVPFGGARERIGHSAHRLRMPTIGDRLRAASPQSRVVTLSMKPRSAVMLAGHGGTPIWFSETNAWSTSSAYASSPAPEILTYVRAHPVDADRGQIWDRALDASLYASADDGPGERPKTGWTPLFAHPLAGAPGTADAQFYELWERSPFSNAALGRMAAALVESLQLGQRGVVDFLGVSFSATDYVGHDFGPESQEVQDTLVRLDRTLGELMATLDKRVGAGRYILALSSDHGVSAIPETLRSQGLDAGRVLNAEVRKIAEAAMTTAHGAGPHVALVESTHLYLTDATRRLVERTPAALRPMLDAISKIDGVMRVFPSAGLETKRTSADPIERAAALSHYPGESGDVFIVVKPNWAHGESSTANHGTLHSYDQHVPVIFYGRGIKAGRFNDAASPADIAPTLASLIKLDLPGIDGKVLGTGLR